MQFLNWLYDRKFFVSLVLWMTIYMLFSYNTYLKNQLVTGGINLGKTQTEIKELEVQNIALRQKVLEAESLTTINQEARQEGFVDGQPLYLWGKKGGGNK